MEYFFTDEQRALRDEVVAFAQQELNDDLISREKEGQFWHEGWQKSADHGILKLCVPVAYGGHSDGDFSTTVLALEGLGYGCRDIGLTFGLSAQMLAVELPLVNFGTEEQKQRFLPKFCSGEWIGAHGLTEPEAGSDVYSLSTRAEKCEGGYRLNGMKKHITLAPIADAALIFATINPERGQWGITAFLVDKSLAGFKTSPVRDKMGLRTVPIGELIFEDCFVPEDRRIGPEGAGWSISHHSLELERCAIFASQLGVMAYQLEAAIEYVREREQFGQAIGKFQAVSNRIADMKLRLETSRLLLYHVARLKQAGKSARIESALLKLHLSECFVDSSLDAIRIHGANGYMTDFGVERDLRDAVGGLIYAGTNDMQRNVIARLLGL